MIDFKRHAKEFIVITTVMIVLNVLQLFATQYFFEFGLDSRLFMKAATSGEELNAILLHVLFGLVFGIILSYLFVRYRDTEMRREAEAQEAVSRLEKAYSGLRNLDRLKSKFITVVSHQIRTPLNSIRWNLEMILGGDLGKIGTSVEDFLRLTYKSNRQIIGIIDDLLVAMDVEEGRLSIEKSPIDLEAMIKSLLIEHEHDMSVKRIEPDLTIASEETAEIDADSVKLRQAISRIIDNAVIFGKEDGRIEIGVEVSALKAVITIKDDGIGIPKADLPHLFDKFYRAGNAIRVHPDASGLGLYIVKAIVEGHDGEVKLDSTEGKGTEVTITIPTANYA